MHEFIKNTTHPVEKRRYLLHAAEPAEPAEPAISTDYQIQPETATHSAADQLIAVPSADSAVSAGSAGNKEFEAQFPNLPAILRDVVHYGSTRQEKELLMVCSIATLSVCFPTVTSLYQGKRVYSNLYLFVVGPPASGKGRMTLCRNLVSQIHQAIREGGLSGKNHMLIVPANSSATAFYQTLNDNKLGNLMMETEGDTLTEVLAQDYGNYSSGFRAAFHHETISYVRRAEHEHVEISNPKLSVILTGTFGQLRRMIPDTENGLFSRFAFYNVQADNTFHVSFDEEGGLDLDNEFLQIGARVKSIYDRLLAFGEVEVRMTATQGESFNSTMNEILQSNLKDEADADGIRSVIKRLGLIRFRIGMILTVLRNTESGELAEDNHIMTLSDEDFDLAYTISLLLEDNMKMIFQKMPKPTRSIYSFKNALEKQLFISLGDEFSTDDWKSKAVEMGMNPDSVERYISAWRHAGITETIKRGLDRKRLSIV